MPEFLFSPSPSFIPVNPGPSWATAPAAPCFHPPLSPTRQKLRPPDEVLDQVSEWIAPGSVGRVATKLAKELEQTSWPKES